MSVIGPKLTCQPQYRMSAIGSRVNINCSRRTGFGHPATLLQLLHLLRLRRPMAGPVLVRPFALVAVQVCGWLVARRRYSAQCGAERKQTAVGGVHWEICRKGREGPDETHDHSQWPVHVRLLASPRRNDPPAVERHA